MATEVTLPALGESVTEGTVTRWLKQVGDSVAVDEALLEVSTDKVDTEIPSPVAGTLVEIKANEDDTVEVGAVLALIGEAGESSGDSGGSSESQAEQQAPEPEPEPEQQKAEEPAAAEEPAPAAEEAEKPAAETKPSGGPGTSVTLPALGESVTEGTVTRWLKSVGDEVAVDEPLLEVSTDKVDTEIPSPVAGTLLEIKVEEDETVEVGAELAVIGSGDAVPAKSEAKRRPRRSSPSPSRSPSPSPSRSPRRRRRSSRSPSRRRRRRPSRSTGPNRSAGPSPRAPRSRSAAVRVTAT
jgi:pyruvate dehydrogenase E2 component (dihydrolipoamide acetyltransferase)